MPGLFLCLDGLDGTGKSTQCQLLANDLRALGHLVTTCADPGGTATGAVLRNLLLEQRGELTLPCEAFLFMASRSQLVAEVIRPALDRGEVVLSDRFTLANVVYQGHAGGLDPALLWRMGLLATGGVVPDLTLVLDLDVATARRRRQRPADRMEARGDDFYERVRAGFLAEAARDPERIRVLDASPAPETVRKLIRAEVDRVLAKRARA